LDSKSECYSKSGGRRFNRALRQGQRPDGSQLHPIMPWRATARMSDLELEALWRYLGSLPPLADAK